MAFVGLFFSPKNPKSDVGSAGRDLQELPWATPLRLVACPWNATKWPGIVVNV